jgi:anti-sigma B factor antagonist
MAASLSDPSLRGADHELRIEVDARAERLVIVVAGEWDLAVRPRVANVLRTALERRPAHVVLDLSRLTFIDSSGLHAAVELHRQATARNVELEIVPGPPAVQRPFAVCGLTESLPFTARV